MSWTAHLITAPAVLALWFLVLVRVRGALRGRSVRLANVLVLLVVTLTLRLPPIGTLLDRITGVVGLQVLVRDVLGITMAATAAHAVASICHRWVHRSPVATAMAVSACSALMLVGFIRSGPARTGLLVMGAESAQGPAAMYWLAYCAGYGGFVLVVAWCAVSDLRTPGPPTRGRHGLHLFGLAAVMTEVYVLTKIAGIAAAATGHRSSLLVTHTGLWQAIPSALAIGLIVAGAATWTRLHVRARWWLWRLRRPWKTATAGCPQVVLSPPLRSIPERLHRRVHELREAVLATHNPDCSRAVLPIAPRELAHATRNLPTLGECLCQRELTPRGLPRGE